MSGGSYNYLFMKEPYELLDYNNIDKIERLAEQFLNWGYIDVATDMQRLAEYCKSAYLRIGVLSKELSGVMEAVEWYASGDFGNTRVKEAVEEYRNRGDNNE